MQYGALSCYTDAPFKNRRAKQRKDDIAAGIITYGSFVDSVRSVSLTRTIGTVDTRPDPRSHKVSPGPGQSKRRRKSEDGSPKARKKCMYTQKV